MTVFILLGIRKDWTDNHSAYLSKVSIASAWEIPIPSFSRSSIIILEPVLAYVVRDTNIWLNDDYAKGATAWMFS